MEEVLHHKTKPVLFIRWPLNSVSALWTQIQFQSISSILITLTSMTSFFFYLRLSTVCLCWGERSDSEVDLKVFFLLGAGILQETSDFSEKSQSERWDFWCYVQFAQQAMDGYVGVYTWGSINTSLLVHNQFPLWEIGGLHMFLTSAKQFHYLRVWTWGLHQHQGWKVNMFICAVNFSTWEPTGTGPLLEPLVALRGTAVFGLILHIESLLLAKSQNV